MRSTRTRRRGTALAALGLALAAGVAGLGPSGAGASSHREAPLIAADPAVDNTDVYAFASPDRPGYATFVANFIPFEEPNGGPNFYPFATDAVYNINIDNSYNRWGNRAQAALARRCAHGGLQVRHIRDTGRRQDRPHHAESS